MIIFTSYYFLHLLLYSSFFARISTAVYHHSFSLIVFYQGSCVVHIKNSQFEKWGLVLMLQSITLWQGFPQEIG